MNGKTVRLTPRSLRQLTIDDEESFEHVGLYRELKQVLIDDDFVFRVPEGAAGETSWARVLFLNLTFWSAAEPSDVLVDDHVPADVVAHAAWHHLARAALQNAEAAPSADSLFLGEAVASAFDLYLVGRLLGQRPDSSFLETQVPAMAEVAEGSGVSEEAFEAMLEAIAADPERAFEDLRQLLFDASTRLVGVRDIDEATAALDALSGHRFASLLHHYELSNWVLYARAHGASLAPSSSVRAIDAKMRSAPDSLAWLQTSWIDGRRAAAG